MKKYLFFVLIIWIVNPNQVLNAQLKRIGFKNYQKLNTQHNIYNINSLKIDSRSQKYVYGEFVNQIQIDTIFIPTSFYPPNHSRYIAKYDSLDNLLWAKEIVKGEFEYLNLLEVNKRGEIILGLNFMDSIIIGTDTIANIGRDIALVKLDSNGQLINTKIIEGLYNKSVRSIIILDNGEILIGGNFENQFIFANDTLNTSSPNCFLARLDSNLNPLWAKSLGAKSTANTPNEIFKILMCDSNLYIIGNTNAGYDTIFNLPFDYVNIPYYLYNRNFLACTDLNGNGKWIKKFGAFGSLTQMQTNAFIVNKDKIYFGGFCFDAYAPYTVNLYCEGSGIRQSKGDRDFYIACYDTSGNFVWNTISKSDGVENLIDFATDTNDNLLAIGEYNSKLIFPNDTLTWGAGDDIYLACYNSLGIYQYSTKIIGGGMERPHSLKKAPNGAIYLSGSTNSSVIIVGNDTIYPEIGVSNLFIAQLDSINKPLEQPNGIAKIALPAASIQVYPNPAADYINITCKNANITNIAITTIDGKMVLQKQQPITNNATRISTAQLLPGIYFISIATPYQTITQKLIIH